MTTYEIKGIVESVGETKAFGANGFVKRELVVNTATQGSTYPNPVLLTIKKDKCALADGLREGQEVTAQVTIDGRRWDGPNGVRYFTELNVWKLAAAPAPEAEQTDAPDEGGDVLPF